MLRGLWYVIVTLFAVDINVYFVFGCCRTVRQYGKTLQRRLSDFMQIYGQYKPATGNYLLSMLQLKCSLIYLL